jgi:hypothetical protein
VLPALQYENLNESLFDKDALTRVLEPDESGDRTARTVMTYDRIALLTDWLIAHKWNAGWIGSVAENSPVWRTLNDRSDGLYKVWREDFDGLLVDTSSRVTKRPSSADYSFHGGAPTPKDLDADGGPRIVRSDWGGARDGFIPRHPQDREGNGRELPRESE